MSVHSSRNDLGRNDLGRNDLWPKRIMAEMTYGRNDWYSAKPGADPEIFIRGAQGFKKGISASKRSLKSN